MTAVSFSIKRGVDGFNMSDITVGSLAPNASDVEIRFNVLDANSKNMNDLDLIKAAKAHRHRYHPAAFRFPRRKRARMTAAEFASAPPKVLICMPPCGVVKTHTAGSLMRLTSYTLNNCLRLIAFRLPKRG